MLITFRHPFHCSKHFSMKQLILLLSLVASFSFSALAQTKILDRTVDFSGAAPVVTLYLSDSLVTNLAIKVGNSFGESNNINTSVHINPASIADNILMATLDALAPGDYFFEVAITSQNETTQVVQFKAQY